MTAILVLIHQLVRLNGGMYTLHAIRSQICDQTGNHAKSITTHLSQHIRAAIQRPWRRCRRLSMSRRHSASDWRLMTKARLNAGSRRHARVSGRSVAPTVISIALAVWCTGRPRTCCPGSKRLHVVLQTARTAAFCVHSGVTALAQIVVYRVPPKLSGTKTGISHRNGPVFLLQHFHDYPYSAAGGNWADAICFTAEPTGNNMQ